MVSFNFFFGIIRLVYLYYSKKTEQNMVYHLEEKVKDLTDELKELHKEAISKIDIAEGIGNETTAQIGIIVAHYESEVKFRKMLEDKVNSIEKRIIGNGKAGIDTEITLLKHKVDMLREEIKKLNEKKSK